MTNLNKNKQAMAGQICPVFESGIDEIINLVGVWMEYPVNLKTMPDAANFLELGHIAPMLSAYIKNESCRIVSNETTDVGHGCKFLGGAFIMGNNHPAPNENGGYPGVDFNYFMKENEGITILVRDKVLKGSLNDPNSERTQSKSKVLELLSHGFVANLQLRMLNEALEQYEDAELSELITMEIEEFMFDRGYNDINFPALNLMDIEHIDRLVRTCDISIHTFLLYKRSLTIEEIREACFLVLLAKVEYLVRNNEQHEIGKSGEGVILIEQLIDEFDYLNENETNTRINLFLDAWKNSGWTLNDGSDEKDTLQALFLQLYNFYKPHSTSGTSSQESAEVNLAIYTITNWCQSLDSNIMKDIVEPSKSTDKEKSTSKDKDETEKKWWQFWK